MNDAMRMRVSLEEALAVVELLTDRKTKLVAGDSMAAAHDKAIEEAQKIIDERLKRWLYSSAL